MFGIGSRFKIYRLRKKYDRIRERADKVKDEAKRLSVLRTLDRIEPTLVMLEEQRLSRFDRSRMMGIVRAGIEEAKTILKGLPEQYSKEQVKREVQS